MALISLRRPLVMFGETRLVSLRATKIQHISRVKTLRFSSAHPLTLRLYFHPKQAPSNLVLKSLKCSWFVSRPPPRRRFFAFQGRCTICGGPGISDAYYCRECTQQEKDRDGCPKIVNLGSSKTDLFYERKKYGFKKR